MALATVEVFYDRATQMMHAKRAVVESFDQLDNAPAFPDAELKYAFVWYLGGINQDISESVY